MAKFRYIGDSESVTLHGITFPKGEPVEVSEDQYFGAGKGGKLLIPIIDKIRGNSQFEEAKPAPKTAPAKKTAAKKPKAKKEEGAE